MDSVLWQLMREGGWVMWALLAFSVVMLTTGMQRAVVLRRATVAPAPLLVAIKASFERGGSRDRALAVCREAGGALGAFLVAGLPRTDEAPDDVEHFLEGVASHEIRRLARGLQILSVTATTAPLLGFLGTVTGMMAAFQALVEQGMGNPLMVALGIKEALTSTAAGLVVALPAQLIHQALAGRLRRIEGDLEAAGNFLLDLLRKRAAEAARP